MRKLHSAWTDHLTSIVEKFILARLGDRRSTFTVHKEFALLSSIFNMVIKDDVAVSNPGLKINSKVREKVQARARRERFTTLEEENRLFARVCVWHERDPMLQ